MNATTNNGSSMLEKIPARSASSRASNPAYVREVDLTEAAWSWFEPTTHSDSP